MQKVTSTPALLLLAVLSLCLTPSAGRAQTTTVIRVGAAPIEVSAQIFYAQELGFFAKAGIDLEYQPNQNAAATEAAVLSNAIDVGGSNVVALAIAHDRNFPLVAVAPGNLNSAAARTGALIVAANSPIQTAKALSGQVVAVGGLGTMSEYGVRAWIDANGGDSSTVKFVELPFPAMPDAIAAGRVAAANVSEPFLTAARKNGARVLAYPLEAVGKSYINSVWIATAQWVKGHPGLAARFAAAIADATAWANQPQNDAASAAILVKYTKIDPSVVATMGRARFADRLTASLLQPSIDVAAKYGKLNSFPAQEVIYTALP